MRLTLFSLIKHNQGRITLVSTVLKYKLLMYFQEDKGLKVECHSLILTDSQNPPKKQKKTNAINKIRVYLHTAYHHRISDLHVLMCFFLLSFTSESLCSQRSMTDAIHQHS